MAWAGLLCCVASLHFSATIPSAAAAPHADFGVSPHKLTSGAKQPSLATPTPQTANRPAGSEGAPTSPLLTVEKGTRQDHTNRSLVLTEQEEAEIKRLKATVKQDEAVIKRMNDTISNISGTVKLEDKIIKQQTEQLKEANATIDRQNDKISNVSSTVKREDKIIKQQTEQLKKANATIDKQNDKISNQSATIQKQKQAISSLKDKLEDALGGEEESNATNTTTPLTSPFPLRRPSPAPIAIPIPTPEFSCKFQGSPQKFHSIYKACCTCQAHCASSAWDRCRFYVCKDESDVKPSPNPSPSPSPLPIASPSAIKPLQEGYKYCWQPWGRFEQKCKDWLSNFPGACGEDPSLHFKPFWYPPSVEYSDSYNFTDIDDKRYNGWQITGQPLQPVPAAEDRELKGLVQPKTDVDGGVQLSQGVQDLLQAPVKVSFQIGNENSAGSITLLGNHSEDGNGTLAWFPTGDNNSSKQEMEPSSR